MFDILDLGCYDLIMKIIIVIYNLKLISNLEIIVILIILIFICNMLINSSINM